MRIAVLTPFYVPAHKAGGPIPGILGVLATLSGQQVHVFTGDRDLGDAAPYPAPHRGTATVDGVDVTYLPPLRAGRFQAWWRALRQILAADVCYLNSLHSSGFTVLPLALLSAAGYRGTVVISPRGELAASARRLGRSAVKTLWSRVIRTLRWDRGVGRRDNVRWLASSEQERADVLAVFPGALTGIAPEQLRPATTAARIREPHVPLRIVAVGRVAPVKGTLDLVRALAHVTEPVTLELVGPAEDAAYVAAVRAAERALPAHVGVTWTGGLPPSEVAERVCAADLLVSLTRGENFGHAIGEALRDGCPVLISDRTPWTDTVAAGAGIVLSDEDCRRPERVAQAIDEVARADGQRFREMSRTAAAAGAAGLSIQGSTTLLELVADAAR